MILYGASGHGKVIIEILENMNESSITVWDDDVNKEYLLNYKIIRPLKNLIEIKDKIIVSIGVNEIRKKIVTFLNDYVSFGNAIHPDSFISKRAKIEEGTVIMEGAVVNVDCTIGKHCIINTSASIDHDCMLGDFVHISPNATLSGDVRVGEGTHIGSGATSIQGIRIGKWCTIGAGAVIIKDIPDYSTAVGNPAKIIKVKNF